MPVWNGRPPRPARAGSRDAQQGDQPPQRKHDVSARSPQRRASDTFRPTALRGTSLTLHTPLLSTALPSSGATGQPVAWTARRTCRPEKRVSTATRNRTDAHEVPTSAHTRTPYAQTPQPVAARRQVSGRTWERSAHQPCWEPAAPKAPSRPGAEHGPLQSSQVCDPAGLITPHGVVGDQQGWPSCEPVALASSTSAPPR